MHGTRSPYLELGGNLLLGRVADQRSAEDCRDEQVGVGMIAPGEDRRENEVD
jgi:hypothetical protein